MKNKLLKFLSYYPPYLGAGIKVKLTGEQEDEFLVTMPLRIYNQNYVGTHFGGSLYSMCDPFYMLILLTKIGKDYLVWDKAASIKFRKPGKGKVKAHFKISAEEVEEIIMKVQNEGKYEPFFEVEVTDEEGDVVAIVEKTLWVKKKDKK